MSYQASLQNQFEFIQSAWANNAFFVRPNTGIDPVMGHGGQSPQHTFRTTAGASVQAPFAGFVTMKGGDYFFTPSMSGIRALARPNALPTFVQGTISALDSLPFFSMPPLLGGEAVAVVQRFLAGMREARRALRTLIARRPADPGPIDGAYGPQTAAAIQSWQTILGITADGIWGPETASASMDVARVLTVPMVTLQQGDSGPEVRVVQSFLRVRGFVARRLFPGTAEATLDPGPSDGDFGPRTTAAVQTWQTLMETAPTGIWTPDLAGPSNLFASLATPNGF
jgi:hypothetical protein